MSSTTSTIPLRCPACGEQTHKTRDSVIQDGGFVCQCGVRSELDLEQFAVEIEKSERKIKDFGRKG